MSYYAVKIGRVPGVYSDWPSCQEQVVKFPNARYKKFGIEAEAWDFVGVAPPSKPNDQSDSGPPDYAFPDDIDDQELIDLATEVEGQSSVNNKGVNMLRATVSALRVSAIELIKGTDKKTSAHTLMSGLDKLSSQIDQLAPLLSSGVQRSSTASFSTGSGVQANERKTYSELNHSQKARASGSKRGGAVGDNVKRAYSESTPLGKSNGSHDNRSKNASSANNYKKRKLDSSGYTDCGFTGIPFPDLEGVEVYTDGASAKNGQATAKAGIGVYWGRNDPHNRSERLRGRQTNNRAEIHAAEVAVLQAKQRGIQNLILYTDSQFLINGITMWIKKWKKNGWKLSTGGDVINREDFENLDEAITGINVKWMHVRGHRGIEGNEAADRLANAGATKSL